MTISAIDVWAQPALGGAFRSATFAPLVERAHAAARVSTAGTADGFVNAMDEGGVETALLSAWCLQDGWMISNEQVAEFVAKNPDRLVGVACAHLDDPEAPAKLETAVLKYGFKALRIVPWAWGRPPNHPSYRPLFAKCIELDIPFCTQVGHAGPRMASEPGRPIPYLDEVALAFPQLKIVCGHIGYPWTDEMIALAWKYDNVYIDTSAYLPRYYPPQLVTFMGSNGQDKVLFGTNFPMLSFRDCADQARALNISDQAKAKFLAGNARRVFNL
ncbi:MAG: amidohydrolase family protein [Rhizomicrobium sp.]